MDKNIIQVKHLAKALISETKLSQPVKTQLTNFTESANLNQLMLFITEGKLGTPEDPKVVEEKFDKILEKNVKLNEIFEYAGMLLTIGNQYQSDLDACIKSDCYKKTILSKDRKNCKKACRIKAAQEVIKNFKGAMGRCAQARNPEACKRRFMFSINRWQKHIAKTKAD